MGNRTSRRRLGVVLAALAIAALGVGCVPETPSGEPPDPCPTQSVQGATAEVTTNCPVPCPTAKSGGDVAAKVTSNCPVPCPTANSGGDVTAKVTSNCPTPCPTAMGAASANVTTTCPEPCPTAPADATAKVTSPCPEPCPALPENGSATAKVVEDECPTTPPEPCNAETESGGEGVTTTVHSLGVAGPTSFVLDFNALSQPDRFQVFYEGAQIHDTGWRGDPGYDDPDGNPITPTGPGLGSATIAVPAGTSMEITVVVTGSGAGTVWDYLVNCPVSTPPV